ncbi:MAG TPA: hypothetical protein VMZ31_10870 [Phycisphaerae bacterium]|nr:hypothetical protein [Phycisphaerae bacterium]
MSAESIKLGLRQDRAAIVRQLREQIRRMEHDYARPPERQWIGTGLAALDERLAGGGLPTGSIVELIGSGRACGGLALATWLTARAASDGGQVVVIDSAGDFYPPAAEQLGLGADRMVLVHPRREVDALWAAEQSLRSPTVAAVLLTCLLRVEHRQSRRLQLAAEAGGGIGLLVRPIKAQARGRVSTAAVRLLVGPTRSEPGSVRWLVQVLRCRGGWPSEPVVVGLEDEACDVSVHAAAVGGADEPVLRLAGG